MSVIAQNQKKLIYWGYLSSFVTLLAGVGLLPLITTKLSIDELVIYFIMQTFIMFISIVDMGYAPQLSKNITYIFSGAETIEISGIGIKNNKNEINYKLLHLVSVSSNYFYYKLSIVTILIVGLIGFIYLQNVESSKKIGDELIYIWAVFTIAIYIGIKNANLIPYLNGKGLIIECRKITLVSKMAGFIVCCILLINDIGLLSVSILVLTTNIINVIYARKVIKNNNLSYLLEKKQKYNKNEYKKEFLKILNNSKLLGVYYLSNILMTRGPILIGGIYLTSENQASYSLLVQLLVVINTFSTILPTLLQTRISNLRVNNKKNEIKKIFSRCLLIFISFTMIGQFLLLNFGNTILIYVQSNIELPNNTLIILCGILMLLDNHLQLFNSLYSTKNKFPFVKATAITSIISVITCLTIMHFYSTDTFWLILIPSLLQISFNAWYWPLYNCKDLECNYFELLIFSVRGKQCS